MPHKRSAQCVRARSTRLSSSPSSTPTTTTTTPQTTTTTTTTATATPHTTITPQITTTATPQTTTTATTTTASAAGTRNGIWTAQEHERYMEAMQRQYSGEALTWEQVAAIVGTRSARQAQTHHQKQMEKIKRRKNANVALDTQRVTHSFEVDASSADAQDEREPMPVLDAATLQSATKCQRWTQREHLQYLRAFEKHGPKTPLSVIADEIPTRSLQQVKTHHSKFQERRKKAIQRQSPSAKGDEAQRETRREHRIDLAFAEQAASRRGRAPGKQRASHPRSRRSNQGVQAAPPRIAVSIAMANAGQQDQQQPSQPAMPGEEPVTPEGSFAVGLGGRSMVDLCVSPPSKILGAIPMDYSGNLSPLSQAPSFMLHQGEMSYTWSALWYEEATPSPAILNIADGDVTTAIV